MPDAKRPRHEDGADSIGDCILPDRLCVLACSCQTRCALGIPEARDYLSRLGLVPRSTDTREDRLTRWSLEVAAARERLRGAA